MNRKSRETRRGFTLVELMMVVLIISLLIFTLIPAINGVVREVKIYQTRGLVNMLDLGVQQYKAAFGAYPPTTFPQPPSTNLDGWWWQGGSPYGTAAEPVGDPSGGMGAPGILTYCLQGPAGMGWRVNRDGRQASPGNQNGSVTADFGPWMEAGNSSLQAFKSHRNYGGGTNAINLYRPTFVDAFGTPIVYFAAIMNVNGVPTWPKLSMPIQPHDRYNPGEVEEFWVDVSGGSYGANATPMHDVMTRAWLPTTPDSFETKVYVWWEVVDYMFYSGMTNQTYAQWTTIGTNGQKLYNPTSYVIWSAGPDQLFGFWAYDYSQGWYLPDLTFNPANFDDITNFR